MNDIEFTVPLNMPTLNEWMRWHHFKQRRFAKDVATVVRCVVRDKPKKPIYRCYIFATRFSTRMPDWVNLYGSFKFLEDALVAPSKTHPYGVGLIVDDSPKHVVRLTVLHEQCKAGEEKTIVKIIPCGELNEGTK